MKIFDLCGTLFKSNTTFDFIKYQFPLRSRIIFSFPVRVLSKIIRKTFNYDLLRKLSAQCFRGLSEEEVRVMVEEFYTNFLVQKKVTETISLLKNTKDATIISASFSPLVSVFSEKLGVSDFFASDLELKSGLFTGRIAKDLLGRKHKAIDLENIDLVVTDNKSDLELCKISNQIIIVVSKEKDRIFWEESGLIIEQIIEI